MLLLETTVEDMVYSLLQYSFQKKANKMDFISTSVPGHFYL